MLSCRDSCSERLTRCRSHDRSINRTTQVGNATHIVTNNLSTKIAGSLEQRQLTSIPKVELARLPELQVEEIAAAAGHDDPQIGSKGMAAAPIVWLQVAERHIKQLLWSQCRCTRPHKGCCFITSVRTLLAYRSPSPQILCCHE